jgi:anti-sigma regulatory factor (Ser/Thr protein kinase)
MASAIQLRLTTAPDELRVVRHVVAMLAREHGAPEDAATSVELAVGEALVNAYEHAYHMRPGVLEIDIALDDSDMMVAVHNHGEPVTDALTIPRNAPTSTGHFGLFLIGQLMDGVQIVHPPNGGGGTSIRMVKHWA